MSADLEAPRALSAFPRPTSLYVPDVPRTVPILDTTSYSPFPTFGGSKTRDPYGLNAFLLHPDDSLWNYVDPMLDTKTTSGSVILQPSTTMDGEQRAPVPRAGGVRKQRSLSLIKKPSPLSQPPVSSSEDETIAEKPVSLQRRRSNSLSSSPALSPAEQEAVIATFREEVSTPITPKSAKKSIRGFFKSRKSVVGVNEAASTIPPVPSLPETPALLAPTRSGSISDSLDPSTPMTSRSNSNYSTMSSASSTSSSEGIKTPGEAVTLDIAITGSKLANALQEAGDKKNKGKNWRGWLGNKKNGKLSAKDTESGSTTPLSDLSADSTPNSSTHDLLSGIPKVTLTPSPAIITPPQGSTPILAPSEQLARQHTWASEQLRRVSMRKLNQLRSPSPHPLALSLRRQNSKLPDEVAFSIRSDQRVFPLSVNSHKGLEGDLTPAQGGLWVNFAISKIMIKLDKGEQPDGILKTKKSAKKSSIVPRPKGALDFINRPPFEERNMIFYPDNLISPISMARPGYGVWDLDFSPYILGLSEIYEPSTLSWPNLSLSRSSTENPILTPELADVIKAFDDKPEEQETSPELAQDSLAAFATLTANSSSLSASSSPAGSPKKERPLSSFKPKGRHSHSDEDDESSESESDGEEESEGDDEPLAVVAKRRSQSFQALSQPRPIMAPIQSTSSQLVPPAIGKRDSLHVRSLSQPSGDKRLSKRLSLTMEEELKLKEIQAQEAMNTVVKARELRAKNASGQMEREADRDLIREKEFKRRSSMLDLNSINQSQQQHQQSKHKRNSSASIHLLNNNNGNSGNYHLSPAISSPNDHNRRRLQSHSHSHHLVPGTSSSSPRPDTIRTKSADPSGNGRKRFSSFYEQKSNSTSSFHHHSSPQKQSHYLPHPQPYPQMHQHFVHQYHPQVMIPPHMYMNQQQRGLMYGMGMGMNMYPTQNQMYGQQSQKSKASSKPRMA